ncbi:MAG: class I SAM-dependent rRNA methyltransferase [Planctomycetaceae bacterium]|nr:class I SAM-dependent rRNA methyltransferase [Planctomycetaceae bacterium]
MKPKRSSQRRPKISSGIPSRTLETSTKLVEVTAEVRGKYLLPFIYRKQIRKLNGDPGMGDLIRLSLEDKRLSGWGLYNPKSERRIRTLSYTPEFPTDFWASTLGKAVDYRHRFLELSGVTDAYRLIHAEADGLPGLMIDRYGDVLSAEVFIPGMLQRCEPILQHLHERINTSHHVIRCAPETMKQEGFSILPHSSSGCPESVNIREHGVSFRIEFEEAHKTGFFCDQRENRVRLAELSKGKHVLDLCCYSGGFSVHAATAGAKSVTAVDLDESAIRLARKNANMNKANIKFTHADIFPWMRDMVATGKKFDVVVLDPPKLIHNRNELDDGRKTHFDMNRLAMQLVAPGGFMLTCTCSGLLGTDDFLKLVCASSMQAGKPLPKSSDEKALQRAPREMRVFHRSGAAADHPVGSHAPETRYLDAIWCRFE